MSYDWVSAYLDRIKLVRPSKPDLGALRELQEAHLRSVPFENLSIHLDEPIVLEPAALIDKIVKRRRGGFCYELNGAFAELLAALGYQVTLLSARVFGPDGTPGPPHAHLALRVDLSEPWLVDVGFGRFARHPLQLDVRSDQHDPEGIFQIRESASRSGELDITMDGSLEYRLDPRGYALSDFTPTCWWQQTSPNSHFTRSLTCSVLTDSGRVTLTGDRLITTAAGARTEVTLTSPAEILSAYESHFAITLDQPPSLTTSPGPQATSPRIPEPAAAQ